MMREREWTRLYMHTLSLITRGSGKVRRLLADQFGRRTLSIKTPVPIVSFTFDDAPVTAFREGRAILKQFGARATYYVSLGLLDAETEVGKIASVGDLARAVDERMWLMQRAGKIAFIISGQGHEGAQVAMAWPMRRGVDWMAPYYRSIASAMTFGMSAEDIMTAHLAKADDVSSGGRQMPSHWGARELNIVTTSSPTGTQFLNAVGCAEAAWRMARVPELADRLRNAAGGYRDNEVTLVTSGDGTTSEGEFWESLNTACNLKLPVLYLIQHNRYAISVPVEVQTAGGSISKLVRGFPDLHVAEVDGCDPVASFEVLAGAVAWCRSGRGPALVHAHVIRPYSHSLSDDERMYRPERERDEEASRDPLTTFPARLVEEGWATEKELEAVRGAVDAEIAAAVERALESPQPDGATALDLFHTLQVPIQTPVSPDERWVATAVFSLTTVPRQPTGSPDHVAILDTATNQVAAYVPTPAGTHGVNWGPKLGGGYFLHSFTATVAVFA